MKKNRFLLLVAGVLLAALSACGARVHVAPPELDRQAKELKAPADKALAFVYRNESFGGAVKMTVKIDGREMGRTGPKSFMQFLLPPGKHVFASEAENTSEVAVEAKAGDTYYIWQEVKMGILYARTRLVLMDTGEGRKGLMECDLVEHSSF